MTSRVLQTVSLLKRKNPSVTLIQSSPYSSSQWRRWIVSALRDQQGRQQRIQHLSFAYGGNKSSSILQSSTRCFHDPSMTLRPWEALSSLSGSAYMGSFSFGNNSRRSMTTTSATRAEKSRRQDLVAIPVTFPKEAHGNVWNLASSSSFSVKDVRAALQRLLQKYLWLLSDGKKIPKGFEDFFPNGLDGNQAPKSSADSETDDSTDAATTDSSRLASTSTGGGGDNDNNKSNDNKDKKKKKKRKKSKKEESDFGTPPFSEDSANIPGLIALLLLVMSVNQLTQGGDETGGGRGQEITFTEFRNMFLTSSQRQAMIERIEIVNKKVANVILRPAAASMLRSSSLSMKPAAAESHDMNDEVLEGFGNSNTSSSTGSSSSSGVLNQIGLSGGSGLRYYFYIGQVENFEEKLTKAQSDYHIPPERWVEVQYVTRTNPAIEIIKALPFMALMMALFFGARSMGASFGGGPIAGGSRTGRGGAGGGGISSIFTVGRSTARKITPEDVKVTFSDVAGCDQAKMEVMEFVDFLRDSSRFTKLGAKIPKGALLCGPPGTGKTLLAKAVAGQAGVPFYSISGSDFIEMFVGVGPSRVRDLFREARQNAPCIIFIDEIDAVGRKRGRGGFGGGGNDERENTLNQLLVEMDGFSPTTGVVVLAGTNRVDILDQALTRPGRFDRQIQVDRPDLRGRKEIFQVHLKKIRLQPSDEAAALAASEALRDEDDDDEFEEDDDEIDDAHNSPEVIDEYAGRLAALTPGFAGADIMNICNEAAIVAARRKGAFVTVDDFEKATERIIGGLESNKILSKHERNVVAHHEAGHAVAGWFLEHADPLLKVTIIPRTSGALGFAQYLPKEVFLRSREQIMDIVCMALAGRAAEEVFFSRVTTGASDDLRRVTQLVYSTIRNYGMSERVGPLAFNNQNNNSSWLPGERPYSDSTAEAMDEEARALVDSAYERTLNLIREHKNDVEAVAKLLLERETITHDDVLELVGSRPFEPDAVYAEYVSGASMRKKKSTASSQEADKTKDTTEDSSSNVGNEEMTPGLALSKRVYFGNKMKPMLFPIVK